MKAKRILAILMVMLLVTVAVPLVVSADTAQDWYLAGSDADGDTHTMYKGDVTQIAATVTVSNSSSDRWDANEAAEVNVGFPVGDWEGFIRLDTAFPAGETFTIDIGSWDGSDFTSAGSETITGIEDKTSYYFLIGASAFTVPVTKWLALRITNPAAGNADLVVKTGQAYSFVTSPAVDPGYPIPELPTIILLATGLAGLAVYFGLKRRKRAYVRA